MTAIWTRRSFIHVAGAGLGAVALGGRARAAGMEGRAIYPVAIPLYQTQYVAASAGFFKEAGLDTKITQGGSGVKTREIIASGQAEIGIGDITHPMQLANRGRNGRVLLPVDTRNPGILFIIRKDLADSGIKTLQQFADWKRPDGRKPLVGVSSIGGTNHVWASYYLEHMDLDRKVTFVGAGDVETMLGTLKTRQIDLLVNSASLLKEATERGWGTLLYDGSSEENWTKVVGGKVPVTSHFTIQATIDKDPAKIQAFTTAIWRATQWIKTHSAEEIFDKIEPFVGSTSKDANLIEIGLVKATSDTEGTIDGASFARGSKVWFREMTGIKPLTLEQVVVPRFAETARKEFPA